MGTADKASNQAEDLKGKVKEAAGEATRNDDLEAKGKADRASQPSRASAKRSRTQLPTSRTQSPTTNRRWTWAGLDDETRPPSALPCAEHSRRACELLSAQDQRRYGGASFGGETGSRTSKRSAVHRGRMQRR